MYPGGSGSQKDGHEMENENESGYDSKMSYESGDYGVCLENVIGGVGNDFDFCLDYGSSILKLELRLIPF